MKKQFNSYLLTARLSVHCKNDVVMSLVGFVLERQCLCQLMLCNMTDVIYLYVLLTEGFGYKEHELLYVHMCAMSCHGYRHYEGRK